MKVALVLLLAGVVASGGDRGTPAEAQDRHGSEPQWKSLAASLEDRGISSSPEDVRAFLAAAAANASGLTWREALSASSAVLLVELRRDAGSCDALWLLARNSGSFRASSSLRMGAAKALCRLGDTERGAVALLHELLEVEKRVMDAGGDSARRSAEMVVTDLAEEIVRCGGPDLLDRLIRQYLDPDYTVSARARTALRRLVAERVLEPQQLQLLVDPIAQVLRRRPEGVDVNLAGLLVFFDIVARDHFMEIVAPLASSSDNDVKRELDTYLAGGPKLVPVELIGPKPAPVCGGGG